MKVRRIVIATALVAGLGALVLPLAGMNWMESLGLASGDRIVRQRIDAYWTARLSGKVEDLAPYAHPLQKSLQDNSILITEKYEILDVEVAGDRAMATVHATYRIKDPKLAKVVREVTVEDDWVRYKGTWYREPHPVGLGETLKKGMGKWKPPVDPNP